MPADLVFVWESFWKLHTERPMGIGGQGAIPFSAVLAYASRFGMVGDEADWFSGLIGAMDEAWFTFQRERRETAERLEEAERGDKLQRTKLPGAR